MFYRAFDFREEDDVYDKLAISVDGDLLVDVYLQNRKSMQIQRAGGAQARVREVELLKVKKRTERRHAAVVRCLPQRGARWGPSGTGATSTPEKTCTMRLSR